MSALIKLAMYPPGFFLQSFVYDLLPLIKTVQMFIKFLLVRVFSSRHPVAEKIELGNISVWIMRMRLQSVGNYVSFNIFAHVGHILQAPLILRVFVCVFAVWVKDQLPRPSGHLSLFSAGKRHLRSSWWCWISPYGSFQKEQFSGQRGPRPAL